MLPRAILFSSDERIAEILVPVFAEFGVALEPCDEIFGAVEQMTAGGLEALVADWSEELEASFFLKTARDLTCVKSALVLAVVKQEDVDKVFELGVDGVLIRPFTAEQVRNTLCTVGRFTPPPQTSSTSNDESAGSSVPRSDAVESTSLLSSGNGFVHGTGADEPVFFSSLIPAVPSTPSNALRFAKLRQKLAHRLAVGTRMRRSAVVTAKVGGLLALAGLSLYFGLPRAIGFRTVSTLLQHTTSSITSASTSGSLAIHNVRPAPAPIVSRSELFDSYEESSDFTPAGEIEVKAVLPPTQVSTIAEPRPTQPEPETTVEPDERLGEVLPSLQSSVPAPRIPESLLTPLQEFAGKPRLEKAAAATHWMLQPVSLPEDVARGLLIHQVSPIYPTEALHRGVQGAVVLHAFIGKDGNIRDLKLMNGYVVLGRAAFDAVKQWRFKPYAMNGEIVDMQTLITVNFTHP